MAANIWVYITTADEDEALSIGRTLVEQRLAACVNILGPIHSIYWWNGRVNDEREVAFVAKTRKSLLAKLTAKVKALHSYECPCIVAMSIEGGNPDFLKWIGEQTEPAKPKKKKKA